MGLLDALGLAPTAAMRARAAASRTVKTPSPELQAVVTRFHRAMEGIKALEAAGSARAGALRKAAIAAGNLATSPKGIVRANAAFDRLDADVEKAQQAQTRTPPAAGSQPGTAPTTAPAPTPPAPGGPRPKPEFKGYPSTLGKAETLIGQVTKYGFSEGRHATTMDAADRADVKEIWCSGLSNWALAEAGYDLDAPVPGASRFVRQKKVDKKTGQEQWVTVECKVSLRSLVEGGADNLFDTPEEAPDKPATPADAAELSRRAYAQDGLFGETPADDDPRVKGAAGAFVLAGIGSEVLDLQDVKPGDFAQTREVGSPIGHAFQIHACQCVGECLVGPSNAPTLLKDLGGEVIDTPEGRWYAKASFRIDGNTSPLFVGAHTVLKTDWLESNVASSMEDKNDKDGGVQVRHARKFEDPAKGGKRTYVGRLGSSSWAGFSRADPPLKRPGAEAAPDAPPATTATTAAPAPVAAAAPAAPAPDPNRLSGAHWVSKFPTSRSTADLVAPFKSGAEDFIAAIEAAGGEVEIAATLRPPQRAYLMHWAWMIGKLGADATDVPAMAGVDVEWDHGDPAASAKAAKAMISAYQLVHKPSLTSRHTQGKAIDMDITGIVGKTMKDAKGQDVDIKSLKDLHAVGASYGVRKLVSDPPHWSDTGG